MKLVFLQAGEIVSTHGVHGEVKMLPWSDGPEFLCGFHRVRIDGTDYVIENCRIQKTCNLLKLRGVDTVEAGQALRGKTVEVYRADAPVEDIYAAELIGMTVFHKGEFIGEITQVLDLPGNAVYVVKGQYEYMIPAVKQFILETDLDQNVMQVALIEGMRSDEN